MKWRWVPPRFDWLVLSAVFCAGLLGLYAFETAAIHLGSSILASAETRPKEHIAKHGAYRQQGRVAR